MYVMFIYFISFCYGFPLKGMRAVSLRPRNANFANDYLDFLGEYEVIYETAVARESGP
jgi:hypothetical protein